MKTDTDSTVQFVLEIFPGMHSVCACLRGKPLRAISIKVRVTAQFFGLIKQWNSSRFISFLCCDNL